MFRRIASSEMSNDKLQMSNQFQNLKKQKSFDIKSFGIHLTFGF